MNKKTNTVLFILGATVVNIVIMLAIFIGLFVLYARFVAPTVSTTINQLITFVIFIGSVALTYLIYHRLIKLLSKKMDMDKHFDPIFRSKKKPE